METGIVFAGQGAQYVGMGKDLAESSAACKALFEQADRVLGYALSKICFEGPESELTKSNHCQPAIFVTSMACYTALREQAGDVTIKGAAGLSLGEWTALHMAGALSFEDTLKVLEARGRFMQEACEERDGAMLSVIGLDEARCRDLAGQAGVEVANLNSEAQTVLSGERAGILKAETLANEAGAKRAVVLNVAGAFHSSLMQSAAERLAPVLDAVEIKIPAVPVVANVTGQPHGAPDEIRAAMLRQITESVRWLDCVQWFPRNGMTSLVECGPGKVLAGLIKRIDRSLGVNSVQDAATLEAYVNAD